MCVKNLLQYKLLKLNNYSLTIFSKSKNWHLKFSFQCWNSVLNIDKKIKFYNFFNFHFIFKLKIKRHIPYTDQVFLKFQFFIFIWKLKNHFLIFHFFNFYLISKFSITTEKCVAIAKHLSNQLCREISLYCNKNSFIFFKFIVFTVRHSHPEVFFKTFSKKNRKIYRKTPVLESLF